MASGPENHCGLNGWACRSCPVLRIFRVWRAGAASSSESIGRRPGALWGDQCWVRPGMASPWRRRPTESAGQEPHRGTGKAAWPGPQTPSDPV